MTTEAPSLILVDDDEPFRQRLGRALGDRGFSVTTYASVEETLAAQTEAPEYAVIDLRMGGASGLELLKALHEKDPGTRAVMLTGYGSIPTAVEATKGLMSISTTHACRQLRCRAIATASSADFPGL